MEATFYDERPLKRPMTLDLGGPVAGSKRHASSALLSSPDLQLLKLASPELERFIMSQHPSSNQPCMYNPSKEEAQFDDVMGQHHAMYNPQMDMGLADYMYNNGQQQMQQQQQQQQQQQLQQQHSDALSSYQFNPMHPFVGGSNHFEGGVGGGMVMSIKEEPQTVPPSCPSSPIDLVAQERLKLERKRLRNRIAASKCRRRKLEKIAKLEDKVARLKGENADLSGRVARLRDTVCRLKEQVMMHVRGGCDLVVTSTHYGHDL